MDEYKHLTIDDLINILETIRQNSKTPQFIYTAWEGQLFKLKRMDTIQNKNNVVIINADPSENIQELENVDLDYYDIVE